MTGPRIIPARAGFTLLELFVLADFAGSSPLARGLRGWPRGKPRGHRIIPARAGFTSSELSATTRKSDHPRSRGVY